MPDATPQGLDWRLLSLWNVSIVLSYDELESEALEQVTEWEFPLGEATTEAPVLRAYRVKDPSGLAWLCQPLQAPPAMMDQEFAAFLGHPDLDLRHLTAVRSNPLGYLEVVLPEAPSSAPGVVENVRLTEHHAGSMTFDVSTPRPALLTLSQSYYPGWRARVDGRQMDTFPANLAQVCVPVPAGRHEVRVYYRPPQFVQGAVISLASILLLILGLLRWRNAENLY